MAITRVKKNTANPISRLDIGDKAPVAAAGLPPDADGRAEKFIEQAEEPAVHAPAASTRHADDTGSADRERQALAIIKRHVPWTAGAAFVPIPGLDLAGIIGVQVTMVSKLSEHYGVPFKQSAAKSSVASLMAILLQGTLAGGLVSFGKMIPGVGTLVAVTAMPAFAAAGTYAIGKVFITHFEAGGTFLDFAPKKVEAHFRQEFERARKSSA